jgi:rRNA maturation protein Nop10
MFLIAAIFDGDTQEPGMYMLDGVCAHCGALVTVPCPADGPDPLEKFDDMRSV